MSLIHVVISILSMAGFGWLGWRMANARGRNPAPWMIAGVIFPPLLLILMFLKSAESEPSEPADENAGA
ncbi:MAG: hypothetical protein JNK21_00760 [Rhodospirillaceae bacterium]|nr:hypothetical protein [Rhodospirillaceae bacterium]